MKNHLFASARIIKFQSATIAILLIVLGVCGNGPGQELDVWIGSGGPDGIHHLKLNTAKGTLSKPTVAAGIAGSGFITLHPSGKFLYSTGQSNGEPVVAAFRVVRSKGKQPKLEPINSQPIGDGGAACVAVDKTGTVLMSAQYGGGSVATFPLNEDGSIGTRVELIEHGAGSGVDARRQAQSHPHWVGTSPDNKLMLVPDLGMDRVVVYRLDPKTATLTAVTKLEVPPGAGPRHMKFHPSGNYAYVLNELALTVSCFAFDAATESFAEFQIIETLPKDQRDPYPDSAAEIRIHPSGKFLYTSNRGHDTITVFAVDQETGRLSFVEREPIRGSIPRNFNLDPSGHWLIAGGQASNTLSLFEVDQETGRLVYTRKIVNAPNPICVLFDPN